MKRTTFKNFAVCVKNDGYAAALEPRKIYRVRRDAKAAALGLVRVIDESGSDYLYPSDYFAPIELPSALRRVFSEAS
jgi:hypothetical protein